MGGEGDACARKMDTLKQTAPVCGFGSNGDGFFFSGEREDDRRRGGVSSRRSEYYFYFFFFSVSVVPSLLEEGIS